MRITDISTQAKHGAPCICIGDDRLHIVDIWHCGSLIWRSRHALVVVLAIVKLLCAEEAVDLVRHRRVWVVPEY